MAQTETFLSSADDRAGEKRFRRARWMVLGALFVIVFQIPAFAAVGLIDSAVEARPGLWRQVTGLLLASALGTCMLWLAVERMGSRKGHLDTTFWVSFALLLATVAALDMAVWSVLLAAVWLSVVAAAYPGRPALSIALILCVVFWFRALYYPDPDWSRVLSLWLIGIGFASFVHVGNIGILRLWDLAKEIAAGREAQERLAATAERLRIARDIHDLLGHSLSGIAIRSELAARLVERDPDRAVQEMLSVQMAARETLWEVRSAVSGYRDVDVLSELESVCEVLTAAGVDCLVDGSAQSVPCHLQKHVAWIIREAGTNVVRHSSAKKCRFTFGEKKDSFVVEVHNDGVGGTGEHGDTGFGSGITGLSERAAAVGGSFTASRSGADGFLLRAVFPSSDGQRPGVGESERA